MNREPGGRHSPRPLHRGAEGSAAQGHHPPRPSGPTLAPDGSSRRNRPDLTHGSTATRADRRAFSCAPNLIARRPDTDEADNPAAGDDPALGTQVGRWSVAAMTHLTKTQIAADIR